MSTNKTARIDAAARMEPRMGEAVGKVEKAQPPILHIAEFLNSPVPYPEGVA